MSSALALPSGAIELGHDKVNWKYWEAIDKGERDPVKRKATPEFEPIRKRLGE
jgi:hypothetical protein